MPKPLIVGFSGKKRVGKDTAADIAAEEHGFERDAFAAPIKTIAQEVFHLDDHQVYGGAKEKEDPFWGMTPREIMQRTGTEFARGTFHEEVWVDSFRRRMEETDAQRIVVTDVRFPNEVEAIQELGGYVVRIRRPEKEPDLNPVLSTIARQFPLITDWLPSKYHQSETALDAYAGFDRTMFNSGSLKTFELRVDRLLSYLTSRYEPQQSHSHSSTGRLPRAEGTSG